MLRSLCAGREHPRHGRRLGFEGAGEHDDRPLRSRSDEHGGGFDKPHRARTGRVANSLAGNDKFFADRLASMADQRFRVIRKAANNTVLQRLVNLSTKVGDNILEIYKPGIVPVRLKDGRIGAAPDTTWRDDPTIFRVMVDGRMVLLRVANPKLAKAYIFS